MPNRLMGNVLLYGNSHKVLIDGNPFGRTVIQVDGVTVYDKKSTIVQKAIDFDLAPGKKATLKWHQSTGQSADCVVVDGSTTELTILAETLEQKKARQKTEVRIAGGAALALAAGSFLMNYISLRNDGTYYPDALTIVPVFACMGVASFLHPRVNLSPKTQFGKILVGVAVFGLIAFGFTLFNDWFLATFSNQ